MSRDQRAERSFVLCIKNGGYETDLDVGKVYVVLPDPAAVERGRIRVVDESGDDYLYPRDCFMAVELSRSAKDLLSVGG